MDLIRLWVYIILKRRRYPIPVSLHALNRDCSLYFHLLQMGGLIYTFCFMQKLFPLLVFALILAGSSLVPEVWQWSPQHDWSDGNEHLSSSQINDWSGDESLTAERSRRSLFTNDDVCHDTARVIFQGVSNWKEIPIFSVILPKGSKTFWRLMVKAIPKAISMSTFHYTVEDKGSNRVIVFKTKHTSICQNAAHLHSFILLMTKTIPTPNPLVNVNNWPWWLLLESLLNVLSECTRQWGKSALNKIHLKMVIKRGGYVAFDPTTSKCGFCCTVEDKFVPIHMCLCTPKWPFCYNGSNPKQVYLESYSGLLTGAYSQETVFRIALPSALQCFNQYACPYDYKWAGHEGHWVTRIPCRTCLRRGLKCPP